MERRRDWGSAGEWVWMIKKEERWKSKEDKVKTLEVKNKYIRGKNNQHLCCGQHRGQ